MEDWRFQYPSVFITFRHQGDRGLAELYRGEALKLLYELKNLMKFRRLGQLKMTRLFIDGTVITAHSVFGLDFIDINVIGTKVLGLLKEEGECSITLLDVPSWVAPMKNPGRIRPGERMGIDYHKTYYTVSSDCQDCSPLEWNLCLNPQICRPFYFEDSSLPYHIPKDGEPDPNNHCILTDSMCQAEVIEEGEDEGGTYIIWKAYTEGPGSSVRFTRSGQGFMKMRPVIKLADKEVCFAEAIIDVDCCKKSPEERPVELYWEKCEVGFGWCKVPEEVKWSDIAYFQYFSWILVPFSLWVDTTTEFGCLKHNWSLNGPGELILDDLTTKATWKIPVSKLREITCHDRAFVAVSDRCGTTDIVKVKSCCDEAEPISIIYTSPIMSCNESQTLRVSGGCPPFAWSLISGGGHLSPSWDGGSATYTAPSSNPNCSSNPTIRVSDCCGKSAQITLAVNCYTYTYVALRYHQLIKCSCYKLQNPNCGGTSYNKCMAIRNSAWQCNSIPMATCHFQTNVNGWCGLDTICPEPCAQTFNCPPPPPCVNLCPCDPVDEPGCWNNYDCTQGSWCSYAPYPSPCDTLIDARDSSMRSQGCCPINPFTGLPY